MTRQLSRPQAALLAVVVLVSAGLATWALLTIQQKRGLGSDAFAVEANFADVGGVEVGTRVRLQGIDAGEVVAVVPPSIPGAPVKLRMLLSGKLRHLVTSDARVQIASESLLTGRYVRILPGSAGASPVENGGCLASVPSAELADAVAQLQSALEEANQGKGALGLLLKDDKVRRDVADSVAHLSKTLARVDAMVDDVQLGKGTLGKILQEDTLYRELLSTVTEMRTALGQDVRRLVESVRQNSDAIKSLPVVRSYVVDVHKELVRPDCQRFCKWFPESDLFEPGRAVLTTEGRKQLDRAATWVNEHKEPGSEVVIAGFASLDQNAELAQTITRKQSEAVCEYLRSKHSIHSTGWWWWSTRTVRSVGAGTNHPALPGSEKLPGSRIELIVFVPGK